MTRERTKSLRFAEALADAEERIVEALPGILDGLIARAREGDPKAAVYLVDRIMGRVATAKIAPADDRDAPYGDDYIIDLSARDAKPSRPRINLPGSGAGEEA